MSLATHCVTFLLVFIVIPFGRTHQLTGAVPKQKVIHAPEKPRISDSFQVEVEGIFKQSMSGADGTLYFDRLNNIAAMEMLWQNDFERRIYSFDTNELIVVKGYDCEVKKIPDNPKDSFFPFTVDPDSGRKVLGSPEEALYFTNSRYVQDVFDGSIETYMYQGYVDVPMYQKKNCSVIHHFSMPNFATAHCDSRFCDPVLLSISVYCAGVQEEIEGDIQVVGEVDHIYRFYNFIDSIQNENAFHPPSGIYCNRKNTKSFPSLPMYFSFTYDITKNAVQVDNVGGLKILHKKIWYDGDLQLIRVDGFDDNGFQLDTRVYDFYSGIAYSAYLQLNVTTRTTLDTNLSLQVITLLPPEIFPRRIQKARSSPVFIGLRKLHGIEYHVWSVMTEGSDYSPEAKTVTELFFQTSVSERNGEVIKETGQQLSFTEIYTYMPDEYTNIIELSEITFVPINNFRSVSRDFSAFDVSRWFEKDEKRAFELDVRGPSMIVGTKSYSDFLEQLYLEIVTLGNLSITRISTLKINYRDPARNITTFSGWILESPGNGGLSNESNVNTAFSELERLIREGNLEFTIVDKDGETQTFVVISFRQPKTGNKDKSGKDGASDRASRTYSGGVIAVTALTMLIVGFLVGTFGITALSKKCTAKQRNTHLFENPSTSNKGLDLNNTFPEVS